MIRDRGDWVISSALLGSSSSSVQKTGTPDLKPTRTNEHDSSQLFENTVSIIWWRREA